MELLTKIHSKYSKEIGITTKIEAYIQYIVLKKTLESISFEYRRGNGDGEQDRYESTVEVKEGVDETPEVNARQEIVAAK